MNQRSAVIRRLQRASAATLLCAAAAVAQVETVAGPPPPAGLGVDPRAQRADPAERAIDESRAAADFLRRRLGLKEGPSAGPPVAVDFVWQEPKPVPKPVPIPPPTVGSPAANAVDETAAAATALQRLLPTAGRPTEAPMPTVVVPLPVPQDPNPPQQPVDPTDQAANALTRVLPTAERPTDPSQPGETVASSSEQGLAPVPPPLLRGTWSIRFRGRRGAGDSDQDLISVLDLDIGHADTDLVSGHFSGRAYLDIDGAQSDNSLNGLDESLDDDFVGRIWEAYADVRAVEELEVLRLGRQDLYETPTELTFDGLRAESRHFGEAGWWASAYGGVPVHQYESSPRGDLVFGLAGGMNPWDGGRLRFDYLHLEDELTTTDAVDDLVGVSLWQRLGEDTLVSLSNDWRDGDPRELRFYGKSRIEPIELDVRVNYRELLTEQQALVTELDPFYDVLLTEYPYRLLDVELTKDLSERSSIAVGGVIRRLSDASDEGEFNRDYERLYLRPSFDDVFTDGLSLTFSGEFWDSGGTGSQTMSGDLTWRANDELRFALGSAYDLYKYDSFSQSERDHVRTWYLRVRADPSESLRIDAAYEYELDDDDQYHMLRAGVTWRF